MSTPSAAVGVFGGSGFYSLLEGAREYSISTPYGPPSDAVTIGEIQGIPVAFLPRHGRHHSLPPHRINYRANLWAMKELGVTRILGPCAAGSLQPHVQPGDFVVCDQLVDRTNARADTFYDGDVTTHISTADPYCPVMRQLTVSTARELRINVHEGGTMVVIQGPRFSTRAESKWFREAGWEVINMTGYPEAVLARELEICYANVSLITDYDSGLEGLPDVAPVSHDQVIQVFNDNNARLRDLIFSLISKLPDERTCVCASALQGARLEA
ncbi:MAG: S-methyl-5'-thioadenosine phosphorylase [Actinomycetota bacterium]